jgi:hypothetical protein
MSDNDHEHRAYQVWDGSNCWADISVTRRVERLEERILELEGELDDLSRKLEARP